MTAAFIAGILVGWFALAAAGGLLLGAVISRADEAEAPEPADIYVPKEWSA